MMTDPIADFLTRIRNATRIKRAQVRIPRSKLKIALADVLKREGYITGYRTMDSKPTDGLGPQGWLEIDLKYGPDGEDVITSIQRVSTPGRRIYKAATDLKPVVNGLGIDILTTSRGVLSDRECRQQNVGGEVMARVV
ncbi:MAG TPA: 30S ribosomal protein S8 [Planctomycetes bacterium]|nr:30S ribosomal protein S8 [Planctomycetota bacterium]